MGYGKCAIEAIMFATNDTAATLNLAGMKGSGMTMHELNVRLEPTPFSLAGWRKVR